MTIDEAREKIPHAVLKLESRMVPGEDGTADAHVCEVWWCDQLVLTIYPSRAPGVRIYTKHPMIVMDDSNRHDKDKIAVLGVIAQVEAPKDVEDAMRVVVTNKIETAFGEMLQRVAATKATTSDKSKMS